VINPFSLLRAVAYLKRMTVALESIAAAQLRAHPPARKPGRLTDFTVAKVEDWNARIEREREGLGGGPEDAA